MKRAQPDKNGPSAPDASLQFREPEAEAGVDGDKDEVELVQTGVGGRGKKNVLCAETGAGQTIYQFFSFHNEDGDKLPDNMMRCILWHAKGEPNVIAKPPGKGTAPLVRHMLTHGVTLVSEASSKATSKTSSTDTAKAPAKAPAKKKLATGAIDQFLGSGAHVSKDVLSRIVFKYIVKGKQAFQLVENAAFLGFVQDIFSALGVDPKGVEFVHRTTIAEWVTRDAGLGRDALKVWWKTSIHEGFFSFTMDQKKAKYKGEPMADVILHAGVSASGDVRTFRLLSIVVLIGTCASKDTETRKTMLESVARSYGLKMVRILPWCF